MITKIEIIFRTDARNYIRKLKDKALKEKIKKAILKLKENLYYREQKKGDLAG